MLTRRRAAALVLLLLALISSPADTQSPPRITPPERQFGAAIGDDYFLATYSQLAAYWRQLDHESDRMSLVDIGRTEEGRTQWMAVISAPENLARLPRLREITRRLAYAEGVGDDEARTLAGEGRAVVMIAGGLHADEVLGSQQLIQTVYELVSRSDAETMRILRDVVVLVVDANPDGHELVANWYMRDRDPQRRTLTGIPRLYQKYAGHDNNRDFYMSTQAETINLNRVLYHEWFPQIVYDHHQTGPPGTVMFAPPFRGPFNYVFDPLIPAGIDLVGAAMHARFASEQKPGVTMRSGSNYSSWWNGGLRTSAYFHNQIGLLTETIGSPTPTRIPVVPDRRLPSADLPYPIEPQTWHFRQSIEYSLTANRAVLDLASRHRETLLYNMYRMGRNSIERGSRDTWTASPHREAQTGNRAARDPRGYIVPADQADFLTATKFVTTLFRAGVVVERATAAFEIGGRHYPAESFVVRTAQAFRPYVLDMFEPQDYPDDIPYPGAPPTPPYDASGWTLAFQMGIAFDRILDTFDGPFVRLTNEPGVPRGEVAGHHARGYLLSHRQNDAFVAVNRLLAAGESVYWLHDRTTAGSSERTGSIYVAAGTQTRRVLERASRDLGLRFVATTMAAPGDAMRLRPVRIGLWDRYGGSEESGWIRWLLERYEFPFDRVYAKRLDAGQLASDFDVLIFPRGAIPIVGGSTYSGREPSGDAVPTEFKQQVGAVTVDRTIPQLKTFVEGGGTLLAIGDSTAIAAHFGLPITSALTAAGRLDPAPREQFYVPGAVLRAQVNNQTPLGYGFESQTDVYFDDSPVFRLGPDAAKRGIRPVAWYGNASPLRSGWAWGQALLKDGVAVLDAPVGRGRVLLFGPEITFRAQPHGTFKFLFNGILYGGVTEHRLE